MRFNPFLQHLVSPVIQGQIGMYRYDGGGIVAAFRSIRFGIVLRPTQLIYAEVSVEGLRTLSYEWNGIRYGSDPLGSFQVGLGIPMSATLGWF